MALNHEIKSPSRFATGVPGLDTITGGGFLRGGTYLIMGPPGAGKTILANQIGFHHVEAGESVLYITMLAESHDRMFGHLRPLKFFDEAEIAEGFNFISAFQILEKEGLDGLLRSLAQLVRKFKASLVFIDGIASLENISKTPTSFKKFVHDLNTVLSSSGCTAFLLSSMDARTQVNPEHTMVDGIVSLTMEAIEMVVVRQIEVRKLRGTGHLFGRHFFKITDAGIKVFPRTEAVLKLGPENSSPTGVSAFGVPKLDRMLRGGLTAGTTTALVGPAGCGKSVFGIQFLVQGAKVKENGLYFGLYETPARILRKSKKMGIDLDKAIKQGRLELLWESPSEIIIDEEFGRILEIIRKKNIRRVFLDGYQGLKKGMIESHRLDVALTSFVNELRRLEVSLIITEELPIFPDDLRAPMSDQSAITDNILILQHVMSGKTMKRGITILKGREMDFDHLSYEFKFTRSGICIGGTLKAADPLLLDRRSGQ